MSPRHVLFHPAIHDASATVDSFWESERPGLETVDAAPLARDETTDVAIIGAGYCGLAAARVLAMRGVATRVLEAGAIGWGASGRNGGFCSLGASFLGPLEQRGIFGAQETLAFYRILADSVRLVSTIAGEEDIDLRAQGPGVWTFAHRPSRLRELEAQALIGQQLGIASRIVTPAAFAQEAFACTEQAGGLFEPLGFGLHPLAYCLGLARAAQRRGAQLHAHSRVTAWQREAGLHRLRTQGGVLTARRVIVATNGWLPEDLVPELAGRVLPIMSNITTTVPLSDALLAAQQMKTKAPAANTRAHLAYLRLLPGRQLLFGGRGDTTGRPAGLGAMQRLLEKRRSALFPALTGVETSHSWRGLIAATRRLTPALGTLPSDPSIAYAFGCHGNGVAFMTWAGDALGRMLSGERLALPAQLSGLPERFPIPALRLWYLRLMLLRALVEDQLD